MKMLTVMVAVALQAGLASAQTPARSASRQPVTAKPSPAAPSKSVRNAKKPGTVAAAPVRQRARVVIDAGHGGRDPGGPMAGTLAEKDVALQVALRLGDALRSKGVDVFYTRTRDTLIALDDRGRFANEMRGDVFISIHVNAANPNWKHPGAARGFETYFLAEAKTDDARRVEQMENESVRFEGGPRVDSSDALSFILSDMRQNEHLRESSDLAELVQRHLTGVHPGPNRGVKQAGFRVLVTAFMPAILVELGFGTNVLEAAFMSQPAKQRDMARAIATATTEYLERHQRRVGDGAAPRSHD
jgi:N-acetylmuramoyl-L-alanine amidase